MNKAFIIFVGQLMSLMGFILFFTAFMTAYGSPEKKVIIDINSRGEAELEYWVVISMLVFSIASLGLMLEEVFLKTRRAKTVEK